MAGTSSFLSRFSSIYSAMSLDAKLHYASEAARQLSSVWNVNKRLLKQKPPAAVRAGPALEALESSNRQMFQISVALQAVSDAADSVYSPDAIHKLLQSLWDDVQLPELLATLLVWLHEQRHGTKLSYTAQAAHG
jgi:hypothetical protein